MKFLKWFKFLILSCPGFIILYQSSVARIYDYVRSQDWVEYKAKIIDYSCCTDKTGLSISYEYLVNRETFLGNKVVLGKIGVQNPELFLDSLSYVKNIKIYVNPSDPKESVILKSYFNFEGLIMGLAMGVVWVLFVAISTFSYYNNKTLLNLIKTKNMQ